MSGGMWVLAFFLGSEAILLVFDRSSAYEAAGFNAYLFLVFLVTSRFVPSVSDPQEFRFAAPRVSLKVGLSVVAVLFAFACWGIVVNFNTRIPGLFEFWRLFNSKNGGSAIPNLLFAVAIPLAILTALRFSPNEVGLGKWAKNSWKPLCFALLLPAALIVIALAHGKTTPLGVVTMFFRDAASAGFSEEFLFRGLSLAAARTVMPLQAALGVQAAAWALIHLWSSLDEPGPVALVAYLTATSAVPGYLLGCIAVRTRSLAFTSLVHTALDMIRHLT